MSGADHFVHLHPDYAAQVLRLSVAGQTFPVIGARRSGCGCTWMVRCQARLGADPADHSAFLSLMTVGQGHSAMYLPAVFGGTECEAALVDIDFVPGHHGVWECRFWVSGDSEGHDPSTETHFAAMTERLGFDAEGDWDD